MDYNFDSVTAALWNKEISNRSEKEKIAATLAAMAQPGQIIAAGSGSSAYLALLALGSRERKESLGLQIIPTSYEIEWAATLSGLRLTTIEEHKPDWGFDGADEVDARLRLIKGRGGALRREKIVMTQSPLTYILADASKMVDRLGSRFPIPVETVPSALANVLKSLALMKARKVIIRASGGKDGPVITEAGNLILDVNFDDIPDSFEKELAAIEGVVESGLFVGYRVQLLS